MGDERWTGRDGQAVNPTLATSAHVADDVVGGKMNFWGTHEGNGGTILGARIVDGDEVEPTGSLWIFRGDITDIADDAQWAPDEDDMQLFVCKIDIVTGDWLTSTEKLSGCSAAYVDVNPGRSYVMADDEDQLVGYFVTDASYTPLTTTALTFHLIMMQY